MKKYKEYIDRISLSEEKHQQILEALAREEVPAGQTDSLLPVKALPWYKKPAVLRWGGMAAVCCILLLVGISAVIRHNRINLTATTAGAHAVPQTTLAAMTTMSPTPAIPATMTPTLATEATKAPSLAPEATMAPTLAAETVVTCAFPAETGALQPTGVLPPSNAPKDGWGIHLYLRDSTGEEIPLLTEDSLMAGNLLYKARFVPASGGNAETTTGMNVDEYLNSLTVEDFFEEAIPGQIGPQDDILLKIRTRYYRFVPEKADAAVIAQWESLLEKYGLTLGRDR